jgi:Nuclease-related domain/UvrD-like helicase C-terminal domain
MPLLFPDTRKTRVIFPSSAEEQFYRICQQELSGKWSVFYSCTLSTMEKDEGHKESEIDFVLYHPSYGCIVVEVKGGRIRFDSTTNTFYSLNRHSESFEIKNPFNQALVWKSRFVRYLRKNRIILPVSHAICFPAAAEEEIPESAGIDRKLIIGRSGLKDLEKTLIDIAKVSHPSEFLRFKECGHDLEKILVGRSFTTKLYLRDYINSHELRVKDYEIIQETLITPIASSRRLAIEGEAGTGKTMLATFLARYFRDLGKKALILNSNALMTGYLKGECGTGVDVTTYADLGESFGIDLFQPPEGTDVTNEDWSQFIAPDKLKQAISNSTSRYDVIICDEAQDVQPFWWEAIELMLARNDESRFYLLFDRSQGVFGSGSKQMDFHPEEVLPIPGPYFPLVHNYRTTREIAGFSRSFRIGDQILQSHCGRLGYIPQIITYRDTEDCQRKLSRLTRQLIREEGLRPEEITLLSARRPDAPESVIHNVTELSKFELFHLGTRDNWRGASGKIAVSTIRSFKGLETPVGILVNVSEHRLPLDNPIMASLMYVAFSRAKHMLYVMVQENDPKRKIFEEALAKLNANGPMVIEASDANFEFCGTVIHYNPDRVGWLKVDDPAFEKSNIMFFPYDVTKSQLNEIRVGARIRFIPRIEGSAMIASELKVSSF